MLGGCTTTMTPGSTGAPAAPRENQASAGTVPAYGHVYLEGKPVAGARVLAVSYDGSGSVSTTTNESGDYILNIKLGVWNNITADYQGVKHTVWPVYIQGEPGYLHDEFDINLTRANRSTIEGSALPYSEWSGHAVYIEATPYNGDAALAGQTDDHGSYSIEVEPGVDYYVSGNTYLFSNKIPANFTFRNLNYDFRIKLGPGETALLDYRAFRPAPGLDPSLLTQAPKPSGKLLEPTYASGWVYLDGKAVHGAVIEAASADQGFRTTTISGENGSYHVEILPGVPLSIRASYQGLQHTIWPVYVGGDR